VVWLAAGLFYPIFGLKLKDQHNGHDVYLQITNLWDWVRSLFFSFRIMTLLKPDEYVPTGYAVVVSTFETLLGPIFLSLFALAVRQRLKR